MQQTLERHETKLNKPELWNLMNGIYQKVENEEIQTDRQIINEVMDGLKPLLYHKTDNEWGKA